MEHIFPAAEILDQNAPPRCVEAVGPFLAKARIAIAEIKCIVTIAAKQKILRTVIHIRAGAAAEDIIPARSLHVIGTCAAIEHIISCAAAKGIIAGAALDDIIALFTVEIINSIAAKQDIIARTAEHRIAPRTAIDEIIARATGKIIISRKAVNHIIPTGAGKIILALGSVDITFVIHFLLSAKSGNGKGNKQAKQQKDRFQDNTPT